MAKSIAEINRDSNEKRGIVAKTYKLHTSLVERVKNHSDISGKSQAQIISEAIELYLQQQKDS